MTPSTATRGFTLIELLVVVAVLSAASLLAFSTFNEDRSQIRFDDTRQRLQILRRAILGTNGPSTAEAAAGFVADNGALPGDLATLIKRGSLLERQVRSPIFDPKPDDASCANDGSSDDITLDASTFPGTQLVKGHAGDYLSGLSFDGKFRDGWGNIPASTTEDDLNFGWQTVFNASARQLVVKSLGEDNATDGSNFAQDSALTVAAGDWLVPISGWTITVKNARPGNATTTYDIPANRLSVSLLVFVNEGGTGKWLRYATTALPCLDGNDDGVIITGTGTGTTACSRTATASFIDGCKPGVPVNGLGRIPQGRHLLILTDNGPDNQAWTTDDKLAGTSDLPSAKFVQFDAQAGRNLPSVTLEIR